MNAKSHQRAIAFPPGLMPITGRDNDDIALAQAICPVIDPLEAISFLDVDQFAVINPTPQITPGPL
jgi:hypothetical protein